jgi:hypothetical protein
MITRRSILAAAPALFLTRAARAHSLFGGPSSSGGAAPSSGPSLFTSFTINSTFSYNSNYPPKWTTGDGIAPTWADDGNIYIIQNDSGGGGFNGAGTSRLQPAVLDGYTSSLTGTNVAGFDDLLHPPWYLGGLIAVGSILYLTIEDGSGAGASQLVKSTDHGATWTPTPPLSPPTNLQGTYPWGFVQYGQAYTGNGPHNSNLYVYLYASARSAPPNGVAVTLGRCLISNIVNLNGADWSWYQGGDGMVDGNWGAYSTSAAAFTETTANTSPFYFPTGTAQYLPAFGCYIYTQHHYTDGTSNSAHVTYYATPTPWGPFTLVVDLDMSSYGSLYQVSAAPPSVAVDGGRTLVLMCSGNYADCCTPSPSDRYCLHLINASLS